VGVPGVSGEHLAKGLNKKWTVRVEATNRPKLLRHGAAKTALHCNGAESTPCLQGTRSKVDQKYLQTSFWHSPSNFLAGRCVSVRLR